MEIALVLGLLIVAIIIFASERFSVDVVTLVFLVVLILAGILTPREAFEGFSSDFMIVLASIFILSGALSETGLLDRIGAIMIKTVKSKEVFIGYTMLVTGFLSAFMNNTSVTALVTGPVVGMCRKMGISPSRVLIPVAYASILGGTCTLIGTSTNVAVSGYIAQQGLEPLGFFEFFWLGLLLFVTGVALLMIFRKSILPDRREATYIEEYQIKPYLSEVVIRKNSRLIGQLAFESDLSKMEVRIVKIIRDKEAFIPNRSTQLELNDLLLVECQVDQLMKVKESPGLEVLADSIASDEIQTDRVRLAEVLVTPGSPLLDQTLKEVRFRQNYDLVVLAVQHHEDRVTKKIGDLKLAVGDVLLVQGSKEAVIANKNSTDFSIIGDFRAPMFQKRKGLGSALVFVLAVLASSLGLLPLSVAFLGAALGAIIIGAISMDRAYQILDWRLLVLIGGMSAFGTAMENSGAAHFLASGIMDLLGGIGEIAVLAGFVLLVIILTQPMSNAAAALVVLPVALQAAELMGSDPRSYAIAIMLGASVSLITPFEPSCILVYGPGKYRFTDFIRAGLPLTLILVVLILWLVPVFWPLQ